MTFDTTLHTLVYSRIRVTKPCAEESSSSSETVASSTFLSPLSVKRAAHPASLILQGGHYTLPCGTKFINTIDQYKVEAIKKSLRTTTRRQLNLGSRRNLKRSGKDAQTYITVNVFLGKRCEGNLCAAERFPKLPRAYFLSAIIFKYCRAL